MGCIKYEDIHFRKKSLDLIELINGVIEDYASQGYDLTLRQVYYQLVARGHIPNTERSYKNTGHLISNGRLAGLIDWNSITDRTRYLRCNDHWDCPEDVIRSAMYSYKLDKREGQDTYIEVWIEKDALINIVSNVCRMLDVPHFSCRGYTSQSEMHTAAQRFKRQDSCSRKVLIHLGDHDPSGIDMTRDIDQRLYMFGADVEVKRIALTMAQVAEYCPPPNPTKTTDARSDSYISKYGNESWELDALEPQVIEQLITNEVNQLTNHKLTQEIECQESKGKKQLIEITKNYNNIVDWLGV